MTTKNYDAGGRGAADRTGVLLFHGLAGTPAELRFIANRLTSCGHEVVVPTLAGLAGGTDLSGLSRWGDWVAEARRQFDLLAARCDRVYVGGLSAGALLALQVAVQQPSKLSGLLLFAPTNRPNGWSIPWTFNLFYLVQWRPLARLFRFNERMPFGIKDDRIRSLVLTALQKENTTEIFQINGVKVLEMLRLGRATMRRLKSIATPAIIFHPRQDDQSDLSNAALLQRNLAGMVELCVLEDSYHVVTLDKQRNFVAERTQAFIARDTMEAASRQQWRVTSDALSS
jgi:carboxylesterase